MVNEHQKLYNLGRNYDELKKCDDASSEGSMSRFSHHSGNPNSLICLAFQKKIETNISQIELGIKSET